MQIETKPPSALRRERLIRGFTQFAVARAAGIVSSRLSLLERGIIDPLPHERVALARAIGAPEAVLFPSEPGGAS